MAVLELSETRRPAVWLGWKFLDAGMVCLAILWMSDALVRISLGPVVTGAIYAYFTARMLLNAGWFIRTLIKVLPIFIYPAVCLLSVLWSVDPTTSFVAACQLCFTCALAVFVGLRFSMSELILLVAIALGASFLVSLVNLWQIWPPAYSWEGGFLGIYTNKNALGQRAALAVLLAVALILMEGWCRILGLLLLILTGWILILSSSATGILLGFAAAGYLAVRSAMKMMPALSLAFWVTGGTIAMVLTALVLGLGVDPVATILDQFGKTHTLTGRTLLWEIAQNKIGDNPVLGLGYMAYWTAPSFAQETWLISELYGATVTSFHNFVLEIAVATGLPGLLAISVLLVWCGRNVIVSQQDPRSAFAVVAFLLLIALSLLGSSLYRPHEITLFLIIALACSGKFEPAYRATYAGAYSSVCRSRAASINPAPRAAIRTPLAQSG